MAPSKPPYPAHPTTPPVWHINNKIHIQAPASLVFDLITDLSTYPSWNAFAPSAKIIGTLNSFDSVPPEHTTRTKIQVGDLLLFNLTYPDGSIGDGKDQVYSINTPETAGGEPGRYSVNWVFYPTPRFLLHASRLQTVTEVSESEGGGCVWENDLRFYGPLAYLVRAHSGKRVGEGMERISEGLKRFAEERAKEVAAK